MSSNRFSELIPSAGHDPGGTTSAPGKSAVCRSNGAIQVLLAVIINALCILPSFLVSSTAAVIAADLHLEAVVLGFAFSAFWLVASVAAYPMASRANRWGAVRALQVAGAIAFLTCILLACGARSAGTLVIMLALAGCAPALATPAVNMVIMSSVQVRRRSTAFAVASTSPVIALMLAGIVGSAFESAIGWRPLFVLSGITVLLIAPFITSVVKEHPTGVVTAPESKPATPSLRPLVVMMAGVLAGNLALGAATAFMVTAANATGMDLDRASLAVSAGAGASIVL
jgi:MFS family permease